MAKPAKTSDLEGDEQKKFIRWLDQYEAEAEINAFFEDHSELFETEDATDGSQTLECLTPMSFKRPEPGQIRILRNGVITNPDISVPILVLHQWEDDQWLVAPFSHFTEPASPDELKTDLDCDSYRVIEIWNAFAIPGFLLRVQTNFLRRVTETVYSNACKLYDSMIEKKSVPPDLTDLVGPPVKYEYDPRYQYFACEQEQIEPLLSKIEEYEGFFSKKNKKNVLVSESDELNLILYYAIRTNDRVLVRSAINNGADVNHDKRCFIYAEKNSDPVVLRLLADAGADFSKVKESPEYWTACLYEAVCNNDSDMARQALDNGADPNAGDADENCLIRAIRNNNQEILNLLVSYGAALQHTDLSQKGPEDYLNTPKFPEQTQYIKTAASPKKIHHTNNKKKIPASSSAEKESKLDQETNKQSIY